MSEISGRGFCARKFRVRRRAGLAAVSQVRRRAGGEADHVEDRGAAGAPGGLGEEADAGDTDETSFEGWQTFFDDGYGFQLRYPPDWTVEELRLWLPEETPDAQKALKRAIVFQPQGWDDVAPPLHVQVTQGTAEEYALLHVPATTTEELIINGNRVVKEVEDLGSGLAVTRYVYTSPMDKNTRIVLLDYISGFPERRTGNEGVQQLLLQTLSSFQFTN